MNKPAAPHAISFFRGIVRSMAAAAALGVLCPAATAQTPASTQTLSVSAHVRHFSRMSVLSQPASITVTPSDVARGYVDVPLPVRLAVETNSTDAYTLVFARHGEHVQRARVSGLGEGFQVVSDAAVRWRPAGRHEQFELQFRFELDRQLAPGSHPWPIQVSMMPL